MLAYRSIKTVVDRNGVFSAHYILTSIPGQMTKYKILESGICKLFLAFDLNIPKLSEYYQLLFVATAHLMYRAYSVLYPRAA